MEGDFPELNASKPNVARIYDYLLGGLNNFAVDRAAAERVLVHLPLERMAAVASRQFLSRAVRYLAGPEYGISQFLDIGMGLPTRNSVHEEARRVNPAARVAYVDYDPLVVSHGKAMLAVPGCSVVAQGDLRDPATILQDPEITGHLDFTSPIALTLVNILHFISEAEGARRVVGQLRDALAPGSFLVIAHASPDFVTDKQVADRIVAIFDNASAHLWPRSRDEILRFFNGWTMVGPGLVPRARWRPDDPPASPNGHSTPEFETAWGGVARKD